MNQKSRKEITQGFLMVSLNQLQAHPELLMLWETGWMGVGLGIQVGVLVGTGVGVDVGTAVAVGGTVVGARVGRGSTTMKN
jgi:hypothetical protein